MHPFVQIFGREYSSWSFLMLLAFLLALVPLLAMRPKDYCLNRWQLAIVLFMVFIFGVLGTKIVHLILFAYKYTDTPFMLLWDEAGASSPGAHIFGFLTIYIFAKMAKKSFLEINDYFVVYFALAIVIMRVGCFMGGCCHGYPSSLPWACVFPDIGGELARHPTQVYELIFTLALGVMVLRFYPRLRHIKGATFLTGYTGYFFMRFFNEFLRTDSPFVIWPFKLSHIGMIVGMSLCSICIYNVILSKDTRQEYLSVLPKMGVTYLIALAVTGVIILTLLTVF